MDYQGVIIEESLDTKDILEEVNILSTKVEPINERHQTPWVSQWTLHTIKVPEAEAQVLAENISKVLDPKHEWYADFKNESHHYIIFRNKVFFVDRHSEHEYQQVREYGISLGIPEYQVNFSRQVIKSE